MGPPPSPTIARYHLLSPLSLSLCTFGRLPRLGADGFIASELYGVTVSSLSDTDGLELGEGVGKAQEAGDVRELFLEQRLDHFDRQESRTFSQRYFVNKK